MTEKWYDPERFTIEEALFLLQKTEEMMFKLSGENNLLKCKIRTQSKLLKQLVSDNFFKEIIEKEGKIKAIRAYRAAHDTTLKEAKEKIELLIGS